MFKKLLCLTLTAMMILTCLPLSAIAATVPETSGNSLSGTVTMPASESAYAVVYVDAGTTIQGISFRLKGLDSYTHPEGATIGSNATGGNMVFAPDYDGYERECCLSILYDSEKGKTFSSKTELARIELRNNVGIDSASKTITLEVNEFYGFSGGKGMTNLSSSLLDLQIIQPKTISSISMTKLPTKTTYEIGDSALDKTGAVVTAKYTDGSTKDVTSMCDFRGFSAAAAGTKTITVVYGNGTITTSFNITVAAAKLTSIAVTKQPTKTSYYVGESFSSDGIKVTGTYSDNSTADVTSKVDYSGFSSKTAGTVTVTVTSKENTSVKTTFTVTVAVQPAVLQSLSVTSSPNKTSYFVNESFVSDGLKVMGKYSDGSSVDVTDNVTCSGFSSKSAGTVTITVTSNENSSVKTTFTVTVKAIEVSSLTVTKKPTKISYYSGESFDPTGIKVMAAYNNGITSEVTSRVSYSGFDQTAGTKTITVSFTDGGKTVKTTFSVTVTSVEITALTVTSLPSKTTYYKGDAFDPSGIVVTGAFNNGTSENVSGSVRYEGYSSTTIGVQTITVISTQNESVKTTFKVTVTDVELTSIAVTTLPAKTSYFTGETFDPAGIKVTGTYNNGKNADVTSKVSYSPKTFSSAGTQTVTVTSTENTGVKTSFNVTVTAVELTAISVAAKPTKTSYYVGQTFDPTGIKVMGTYNNGGTVEVTNSVNYSESKLTKAGTITVTVSSQKNAALKTSFTITVTAVELVSLTVSSKPNKTSYFVGDALDKTGIKINGIYNDGTTKDVTSNVSYSTEKFTTAGNITVTVTSKEKTSVKASFTVTVSAVELTSIAVTQKPTKTSYFVGDALDKTGIKITGTNNNGTTKDVTSNVTYSTEKFTTAGTITVTVTSKEKTSVKTSFTVSVSAVELVSIAVTQKPTKTSCFVGDTLDKTGIKITGTNNNGTTKDVTSNVTYSTEKFTTAGNITITVTSKEKTSVKTSFTVSVSAVELASIAVTQKPTKTSYFVNETVSYSGIKITGTYNNGTSSDVTSNVTYSGFSSSSAGAKTITVTSKEKTSVKTTFTVTVNEIKISSIYVKSAPTKTEYYVGDALDTSGLAVYAAYNNGTTKDVTPSVKLSGYDSSKAGRQTITASYGGCTTTFAVNLTDVSVNKITVSASNAKTQYFVGDSFSSTGVVVTAHYNNGSTKDVSSAASFSGFSSITAGSRTITVTYGKSTATYTVTVKEPALTAIRVSVGSSAKVSYYVGDVFSSAGLTAVAVYENSSVKDITKDVKYSGFDSAKAGSKTITATYGGKTDTFTVTVREITLTGITITEPTKKSYYTGDTLSTEGLKVTAAYSNGDKADVTNAATISGFDSSKAGTCSVTVSYGGKSAAFSVTINAVTLTSLSVTPPTKTEYFVGDVINKAGMKITAAYSNGSSQDVTSVSQLDGFDTSTSGEKTVTVKYGSRSGSFKIKVSDVTLEGITVTKPAKVKYYKGEQLDLTGMVVTANYSNGSSSVVTDDCSLAGFDTSSEGEQTVVVSYGSAAGSFTVIVRENDVLSIAVVKPEKTEYYVGEEMSTEGMIVTAQYSNGVSEVVTDKAAVSGFDSSASGKKTVTVTYGGKSDGFTVTVLDVSLTGITVIPPVKTEYYVGEELSTEGMSVIANYSDGTSAPVSENVKLSGFDSTVAGSAAVTVTYGTMSGHFSVKVIGVTVEKLTVTPPVKTEYYVGETLGTEGMTATAELSSGVSTVVTDRVTLSGFDSGTPGEKTVTVTYSDKTDTFTVLVKDISLVGIDLIRPIKTEYYLGEAFSANGMTLTAEYSNGLVSVVTNDAEVTGFDSSTAGQKTVTVSYGGLSESFTVNVTGVVLEGIDVVPPTRSRYYVGDKLSTRGLTVTASYSDGTSETVTSKASITGFESLSAGTKTVTVSFGGLSGSFEVNVVEVTIYSVTLVKPNKTKYYIGDPFSTDGMVVTALYSNGTSSVVTDDAEVKGFDTTAEGAGVVTISYLGFDNTFDYTVEKPELVGAQLVTPVKTDYAKGEDYYFDEIHVIAFFSNGTSREVTQDADVNYSDVTDTVTVSYGGFKFPCKLNRLDIELVSIEVTPPTKLVYAIGEELDPTGITANAVYSDGTKADVTRKLKVSGFDSSAEGDCKMTAEYSGKTAEFDVKIIPFPVEGLHRLEAVPPYKTDYKPGESLDLAGMIVTAYYLDGTAANITDYAQLSQTKASAPGVQTVTVSYGDVSTSFEITVSGLIGDVNSDGSVDSADALAILRFSVGLSAGVTDIPTAVGDVNGDERIDSADALDILRASVGLGR